MHNCTYKHPHHTDLYMYVCTPEACIAAYARPAVAVIYQVVPPQDQPLGPVCINTRRAKCVRSGCTLYARTQLCVHVHSPHMPSPPCPPSLCVLMCMCTHVARSNGSLAFGLQLNDTRQLTACPQATKYKTCRAHFHKAHTHTQSHTHTHMHTGLVLSSTHTCG